MYTYKAEAEQDGSGYEWVSAKARCEDCGKKYRNCECVGVIEDDDEDAPWDELDYSR